MLEAFFEILFAFALVCIGLWLGRHKWKRSDSRGNHRVEDRVHARDKIDEAYAILIINNVRRPTALTVIEEMQASGLLPTIKED